LSTSAVQADLTSSWKQEVNRRLADHKSRKGLSAVERLAPAETEHPASGRAAEAAARVAARYAKAPSYSDMLATEARAAVRAAEAASRAALDAQAAAELLLAGLEAASEHKGAWEVGGSHAEVVEPVWEAMPALDRTAATETDQGKQSFGIRWEADMPFVAAGVGPLQETRGPGLFEPETEERWDANSNTEFELKYEETGVVEPATPIHANLIEFPREIVATRKMRPRLAEGPNGSDVEAGGQLSIFEVDPGSISIQATDSYSLAETATTTWQAPEWSDIHLDEQPSAEKAGESATDVWAVQRQLAPLELRLMAGMVDGSLILGTFLALAKVVLGQMEELPGLHASEMGAAVALVVLAVLYHALFFSVTTATPGMMYAGISLCTFDDQRTDRDQRLGRLKALLVSVLPVGLGIAWAIFDEEHLTWHDRLSRTYLRKG
jgi:uncharacterized RDD family membrane protein YckC